MKRIFIVLGMLSLFIQLGSLRIGIVSATGTESWTATELVSTVSDGSSASPCLRLDTQGNVHIVWVDNSGYAGSGTDFDIVYRVKFRNGTWSAIEVVSSDTTSSYYPSLGIDSLGQVHVVWVDGEPSINPLRLMYSMRFKNGTWTESYSVGACYYITLPSLGVDSKNNVHIAWDTTDNIWHTTKFRNGTWSTVSVNSGYRHQHPRLKIDCQDNLHITWWTESGGDIYYLKILPNGTAIGPAIIGSNGRESVLAVDSGGNPHVVWYTFAQWGADIWYRERFSSGVWSDIVEVSSETATHAYNPSIAIGPINVVHVAWSDYEDYEGSGADEDIFYKKCVDGMWTTTEVLTPESTERSESVCLETDLCGQVHLCWTDSNIAGSGTDSDVFYRRTILPILWEYVFEDPCRDTVLRISTDDRYFQFSGPGKEFSVKHDPNMHVVKHSSFTCVAMSYKDEEIGLSALAMDSKLDFCIAYAKDILTGKTYVLFDKPGIEK